MSDEFTIWVCEKTGQAMKVSNYSDEEFGWDPADEYDEGRCPCGGPLRKIGAVQSSGKVLA